MESTLAAPLQNENRQPGIIVTTILVTVLADFVVGLRMIVRKWVVRKTGWDDWTIVAAVLGITIGMALVIVEVHYGFGRHKYYLSQHQFREFQEYSYGEWMQTFATLMFTKVSICLLILRITISKAFIKPLQALIAFLVLSNVVLTVLWIVQCIPLARAWDTTIQGTCMSFDQLNQIILAQAIISIASDFILAAFPVIMLRMVQISLRVKIGICGLMGLGVMSVTVPRAINVLTRWLLTYPGHKYGALCIARTVLNWQNNTDDPTWISIDNWYLRSWEVCVGIIAASVPTLRPGYIHLRKRMQTSQSSKPASTVHGSSRKTLVPSVLHPTDMTKASQPPLSHQTTSSTLTDGTFFLPLQDFDPRAPMRFEGELQRDWSRNTENEERKGQVSTADSEARWRSFKDMV